MARTGKRGKRLGRWELVSLSDFLGWIKANGYTQKQTADRLGVSPEVVGAWKAGRRFPSEVNQQKIAELVGAKVTAKSRKPSFDAQAFKTWRKGRGLSRKALAAELGVSPGSIYQWESGKTTPRQSTLKKLERTIRAKGLLESPKVGHKKVTHHSGEGQQAVAIEAAGRVLASYVSTKNDINAEELERLASRLVAAFQG